MDQTQWDKTIEDLAISLSVDQPVFRRSDTIALRITLKNVGISPAHLIIRSPWIDFALSVRDEQGNELPASPYAQQVREAAAEGRRRTDQLMPGALLTETLHLDEAHVFAKAGLYTVSAQYRAYKRGTQDQFVMVTSNELTIRIT